MSTALELRPYQNEALAAIENAAKCNTLRQLLSLPTGTGKTIVFAELIRRRGGRALLLVHRDELVRQAVEKINQIAPDIDVGVVKAESNELGTRVVVASVQTVSRPARLAQLATDFMTVVVDEAHHGTEPTYQTVLRHVQAGEAGGPMLLGVTATPFRGDEKGLDRVFGPIVYQRTLLEMIRQAYLVDLVAVRVRLEADFDALHTAGGDYLVGELERMLRKADAPAHVVLAYQEHAPGRRALVFTPTVAAAHEMAGAFVAAGIPAEALDARTPINERRACLHRLRSGQTRVIANCAVLTEGLDEPSLDCIIIARPTRSKVLYTQMIGRGTRTLAGKDNCVLIDVVGATERHDLVTANVLFGMPIRQGESVLEAEVRIRAEAETVQLAHAEATRLIAERVDLFRKRKLHWAVAPEGDLFVLGLGNQGGSIQIIASGGQWDVIHIGPRRENYARLHLAARIPLDLGTGIAEDFARKHIKSAHLYDPDAAWRRAEPSDAQIALAREWELAITPGMSRGQLGDCLKLETARRGAKASQRVWGRKPRSRGGR